MAVGFPVPGAKQKSLNGQPIGEFNNSATITNMSTITISVAGNDRWQVGFLYGTKGDGYFFAPDIQIGVSGGAFTVAMIEPPVFELPSSNVNSPTDLEAITAAFNAVISTYGGSVVPKLENALSTALNDELDRLSPAKLLGTTNCYTTALPKNG